MAGLLPQCPRCPGDQPTIADAFMSIYLDPALWLIAWEGDAVAGAALCEVVAGVGWIHHLFVRRPWRRRGLGEALTLSAVGALQAKGVGVARLNVDGQSLTNAHQLYRRVGFRVIGGYTNYQKIISLS